MKEVIWTSWDPHPHPTPFGLISIIGSFLSKVWFQYLHWMRYFTFHLDLDMHSSLPLYQVFVKNCRIRGFQFLVQRTLWKERPWVIVVIVKFLILRCLTIDTLLRKDCLICKVSFHKKYYSFVFVMKEVYIRWVAFRNLSEMKRFQFARKYGSTTLFVCN